MFDCGLTLQALWISLGAVGLALFGFDHARSIGVVVSTWAVYHRVDDSLETTGELVLIWEFSGDDGVNIGSGRGFIF